MGGDGLHRRRRRRRRATRSGNAAGFFTQYNIFFFGVHSCNVLATRPKVNLVCVCLCQGFQSWSAVLTDREHHEGKKQWPRGITGNIIRTLSTLPKFIIYGIRK